MRTCATALVRRRLATVRHGARVAMRLHRCRTCARRFARRNSNDAARFSRTARTRPDDRSLNMCAVHRPVARRTRRHTTCRRDLPRRCSVHGNQFRRNNTTAEGQEQRTVHTVRRDRSADTDARTRTRRRRRRCRAALPALAACACTARRSCVATEIDRLEALRCALRTGTTHAASTTERFDSPDSAMPLQRLRQRPVPANDATIA